MCSIDILPEFIGIAKGKAVDHGDRYLLFVATILAHYRRADGREQQNRRHAVYQVASIKRISHNYLTLHDGGQSEVHGD